jgi:hypothetical protein
VYSTRERAEGRFCKNLPKMIDKKSAISLIALYYYMGRSGVKMIKI